MPCSDGYANDPDLYDRLDRATRAACELARVMRKKNAFAFDNLSKETRHWVERHDRADQLRIQREKQERERRRLKKKAMKKLSRKEREALGL